MAKVKISYNSGEEMMSISSGNKKAFYGNYWDFSREPEDIAELFKKLGMDVEIKEDLPAA